MSLKTTTLKKFGKAEKLKLLVGRIAVKMALKENDPSGKKYVKLRKQYLDAKKRIQQKYGMRAKKAAKQIVQKSS